MSAVKKVWEDSESENTESDPQVIQEIMHDDMPSEKQHLKEGV